MQQLNGEAFTWARAEFGGIWLGDSRRTERVVRMATRAAERPAGKVSEVFTEDRERQGTYDLLEGGHVDHRALSKALGQSAGTKASVEEYAFVAVDGSSLTLTDTAATKDFGSLGSRKKGRGLKVISALAISPAGVPLGLLTQVWWARTQHRAESRKQKKLRYRQRGTQEKETRNWLRAIEEACARARETSAKLWFLLDREADNRDVLLKLASSGGYFTVRGSWDRLIKGTGKDKQHLRSWLAEQAPTGAYSLEIAGGPNRTQRTARMFVRRARVQLKLCNPQGRDEQLLDVTVVWTREEGSCPKGEAPVDWLLLTNAPVESIQDARHVIYGYTQRWRIEEFHKTWKTGACNVEDCQLRSQHAVLVWATLLAAVTVRIERLKVLARTTPEQPASVELSQREIRVLIMLKRREKKRTETIPDSMPTIEQATRWLAELGGYTGKSSGGPPGSITIRRGLDRLLPAVEFLEALEWDLQ